MSEPETTAPTTCYRHTDRETGRRCTRCGRPACWECLRDAPVGAHCPECVKSEQLPVTDQLKGALRDPLLITKVIIALNILVFAIEIARGSSFGGLFGGNTSAGPVEANLGLYGPAVAAGEWWRVVSSAFIHFGAIHILFNMLILYRLGVDMEPGVGRSRFFTLYAVSLFAGSFGAMVLSPNQLSGGASGAVFGMAAAATIALWQRGVRFYQTGWGPLLAINLVITFTLPDISVGAHLGGLIGGGLVGWLMLHPTHGVRNKTAAFALAAMVCIVSIVGTIGFAQYKYGTCTKVGTDAYNCSKR